MKYINKIMSLGLFSLIAVFTACSSDVDYSPAEKLANAQVFFPSTNPATFNEVMADGVQTLEVTIMRANTEGAITVSLGTEIEADSNAINAVSLPNSVTFQDGAEEATIPVKYNPSLMGYDNPVKLGLTISDGTYTTPYGISSYEFTLNIPAPWKSLGKGTYIDRFVCIFYGLPYDSQYEVEVEENEQVPGFYRIVYPYDGKYEFNEEGDWDDSKTYYLEIHAENPDKVYIVPQEQGINWGYGSMTMGSIAGLYISRGTPDKAEGYYGTLKDGFISFEEGTLLLGMPDYNGGALYSGGHGGIMLALPGYVIADYSCEVEYTGTFMGLENLAVVGNATLGPDVATAKATVVEGLENIEGALEKIAEDTTEAVTEVTANGEFKVLIPNDSPSSYYTLALATYDAAGALQKYEYETFKFINPNLPKANWDLTKPLTGTYDNAILFGKPSELILTPNGDSTFTFSNWGAGVKFTFKLHEDNSITFEDQDVGTTFLSYGEIYVANYSEAGETYSFYDPEVGVFAFLTDYYVADGNIGIGYETFKVTGEAPPAAKGKVSLKRKTVKNIPSHYTKRVNKTRFKLNSDKKLFAK